MKNLFFCPIISILIAGLSPLNIKAQGPEIKTLALVIDGHETEQGTYHCPKLWKVGQKIKVKILNGSEEHARNIRYYAQKWEQYANIDFEFVESGNAEIRVGLFYQGNAGHHSYIGTDARNIPQDQPTVNFGWSYYQKVPAEEYSRVILHEFGHVLGLHHEHQSPAAPILWNIEALQKHFGWSEEMIENNITKKVNTDFYSEFDEKSIMAYPITSETNYSGVEIGWNTELSKVDKKYIEILYPFNPETTEPKTTQCNFKNTHWYTNPSFPSKEISTEWDKCNRISSLSYGNGSWALVTSKNPDFGSQQWCTDANFPSQQISKAWDAGKDITEVAYGNGTWGAVFTESEEIKYQKWFTRAYFPKTEISEGWDEGYQISSMAYADIGTWCLILSKYESQAAQSYLSDWSFPESKIDDAWNKDGQFITELVYGGWWVVITTKTSKYKHQKWWTRSTYPSAEITEGWNEGYQITNLVYGNGQWALVMSK